MKTTVLAVLVAVMVLFCGDALAQGVKLKPGDVIVAHGQVPGGIRVYDGEKNYQLKAVIDRPEWTLSAGPSARSVEIGPDDHIWVTDANAYPERGDFKSGELYEFDPNFRFIGSFPIQLHCGDAVGRGIRGFTFSPKGSIFITGSWQDPEVGIVNLLLEIAPDRGATFSCVRLFAGLFSLNDLEMGKDGFVYASGWNGRGVIRFRPNDTEGFEVVSCEGMGIATGELVYLTSGEIIVADQERRTITIFTPTTEEFGPLCVGTFFPGESGPTALDVWGRRVYGAEEARTGGEIHIIPLADIPNEPLKVIDTTQGGLPPGASSIAVVR